MTLGLLGKKKGMTQIFDESGNVIPVTLVEVGPCTVVQCNTKKKQGYDAVQLGFFPNKPQRLPKPLRDRFEKQKMACFSHLKEFRVGDVVSFKVGQVMTVAGFKSGDTVDVQGITKGRGFQGVMKRHGKHGGPDGHGSGFHRSPGSIGMRTWPGRVLKNMRLPGRMGADQVLIRNLRVVGVDLGQNLLLIRGAIPGAREQIITVFNREKDFESRFKEVAPQEAAQG